MTSLSTRARALCLVLAILAAGGLPAVARADGRVDPGTACVGNPPRQTFDPLSPPCVPFWDHEADNGGATAKGVTRQEIRIAVVVDGRINYTGGSDVTNRGAPGGKIYDLAQSAGECRDRNQGDRGCDHLVTEGLRVWQEYFNLRFQTYGRHLHVYVAFTEGSRPSPERRRAEAAWVDDEVDPFAVVSLVGEGYEDVLLSSLNDLGVMTFADTILPTDAQLAASNGLAWNFGASAERSARNFTGFVCKKVVGKPAVRAGGLLKGQPRVLGMISTNSPSDAGRVAAGDNVLAGVTGCSGQVIDRVSFSECCVAHDTSDLPDDELEQMARFQLQGITTVLVAGAMNNNYFRAAQTLGYEPEWVMLGESMLDNSGAYLLAADVVPGNTIVTSPQVVERNGQVCEQAFREVHETMARSDLGYVCHFYRPLFFMTMAVQLAGPILTTDNVGQGLRAIPSKASGDPATPACWFAAGEHSCVKDAHLGRWDPLGQATRTSVPGCFRTVQDGRRFLPGRWPGGNIDAQWSPNDACSTYSASFRVNLA